MLDRVKVIAELEKVGRFKKRKCHRTLSMALSCGAEGTYLWNGYERIFVKFALVSI
jgi:hypothetical protein